MPEVNHPLEVRLGDRSRGRRWDQDHRPSRSAGCHPRWQCCHVSCCARACWRREQLTSWIVQDWTEMVFCDRRTPNFKGPRRRRRCWNWRSFASRHGLRFNESTGNYGVPRVDRRGAALPRLGDSVCLFCFEPKSIYTYTRISVQPTSLVTALPRSYPDSWQHSD